MVAVGSAEAKHFTIENVLSASLRSFIGRPFINVLLAYVVAAPIGLGMMFAEPASALVLNSLTSAFGGEPAIMSQGGWTAILLRSIAPAFWAVVYWVFFFALHFAFGVAAYRALKDAQDKNEEFFLGHGMAHALLSGWRLIPISLVLGYALALGFSLLMVPGLVLLLWWFVALPAAAENRLAPIESLRFSVRATSGRRLTILGLLLVFQLAATLVVWIAGPAAIFLFGLSASSSLFDMLQIFYPLIAAFAFYVLLHSFRALQIDRRDRVENAS